MRKVQPAIQYSEGRSSLWGGAKLVNCFAEVSEGDKADQFAVMAIPGLRLFGDVESGPVRGLHAVKDDLYAVIGTTLYQIAEDGTGNSVGTIPGDDPVMMADNGTELAIQAGSSGYVYSGGIVRANITNLPPVSGVVYIDGYFVWTVANSDQFVISALYDGLSYDPLDVATVQGDPDNIVGVVNDHRELQFYGSKTIEIWYNSGDADFPFARQGNAFVERGCLARDSIVKMDNTVIWVGEDRIVYRLDSYNPVRISTHAIESKIAKAQQFRGYTQTDQGHKRYILNTELGTWAFDASTGAWAEMRSYGLANYRVGCAAFAFGQTVLGDAYTGKLYVADFDEYTENGAIIPVIIEMPSIQTDRAKATLYSFEAYVETGVGLADDPDPQMMLQWSKDGGRTYSPEQWRSLGREGEYLSRCVWRLGVQFRQLQIRLQMPSKTKRFLVSAYADVR